MSCRSGEALQRGGLAYNNRAGNYLHQVQRRRRRTDIGPGSGTSGTGAVDRHRSSSGTSGTGGKTRGRQWHTGQRLWTLDSHAGAAELTILTR